MDPGLCLLAVVREAIRFDIGTLRSLSGGLIGVNLHKSATRGDIREAKKSAGRSIDHGPGRYLAKNAEGRRGSRRVEAADKAEGECEP